jgi:hypothetical protein
MRRIAAPGRWIWGLSGLVAVAGLAIPGTRLIIFAGVPTHGNTQHAITRMVTVPQPVTSVYVQSDGAPVLVAAGPVRRVQVIETIEFAPADGGPPAVTQSVSGGRLTLAAPACNVADCSVGFRVTVPPDVAVTAASGGGPVLVSGVARADLDSGGGPVRATGIRGPLAVTTEGGPLLLNGLNGPLHADTDGGRLQAKDVDAATATVITDGGEARIGFSAAPDTVVISTDGGTVELAVPGGPYALTTDSNGGPQLVRIATNAAARRSITVTTGGGPLTIRAGGEPPAVPQTIPGRVSANRARHATRAR